MSNSRQLAIGLDIGSNTLSCTKVEKQACGNFRVVEDASHAVRLSEGLVTGGPLKTEAIFRTLEALLALETKFEMRSHSIRAVATAVLRMCSNSSTFVESAQQIIGAPVEIIDGTTEALLTSRGARLGLPFLKSWIVLDIGGQSTEFCWGTPDNEPRSVSMPLGVVGLTEQFGDGPKANERIRTHVRRLLKTSLPGPPQGDLVAVGGTATNLSVLALQLSEWDRDKVHGHVIDRQTVLRWLHQLTSIPLSERISRFGLRPLRADVFLSGLCVLIEAMEYLNVPGLMVSANGLRVGAALSCFDNVPSTVAADGFEFRH